VHCNAPTASDTDWTEIARLYELLEIWRPTPVVRVNRAFAVGQAAGPEAGLALLEPAVDARGVARAGPEQHVVADLGADAGHLSTQRAVVSYSGPLESP
jgi:RNA polymerase sigma-70 factor (ECF subfamily)